jgi:hypothetical protein
VTNVRHLPATLEPAEAAFRVEHPGGTPAFDHFAVAPRFMFLVVSRAIELLAGKTNLAP